MPNNPIKTLVIDNFHGSMTRYAEGDINSGLANVVESFAYDPFSSPGNLTWNESAIQIDAAGDVITDLIIAGKARVESGITYVYCVGHTARLYKIQVNDPTTYDPNYDNPVLLATLSSNSPTFTMGGFMDFFGSTEAIYIGHDKGVTKIGFDGTGESFVGALGSWTQNVPRPLKQFIGNLYAGSGSNIVEIISAGTVSTYSKLTPSFPNGTQIRDIDTTPDGNYLIAVVTRSALTDITVTTTNTSIISNLNSFIFRWNGIDTGYTAFDSVPGAVLSANILFGNYQYTFGYDMIGGAVFAPIEKILTSTVDSAFTESPLPNAVISYDNLVAWATPLWFEDHLEMTYAVYGSLSSEVEAGYWSIFGQLPSGDETDVVRVPCQILASNFAQGSSSNGYSNSIFGSSKIYFSTLESSATTTAYKLFSWTPAPTGAGSPVMDGLYQTQIQLFSKKVKAGEIRIYGKPWVAGNIFSMDLIGSDGEPITGGSKTFTAGSNLTIGDDFAWYVPFMAPSYAIGVRINQLGTTNFTINKIEIDYSEGGK